MNISFKATPVQPSIVYQIQPDNSIRPINSYLVEFEPISNSDINAADKFSELCGHDDEFLAQNIAYDLENMLFDTDKTKRFFAHTRQRSNFDKLDPYEIMGVTETLIDEENHNRIEYLKVAPEFAYADMDRTITGVGKGLVKNLLIENILKYKQIFVDILPSARGFYENLGFQQIRGTKYFYDPKVTHSLMRYA